jgi:hypothetical protein
MKPIIFSLLTVTLIINSCSYDSKEDLSEGMACDTTNITYPGTIVPILENNCYECHGNESGFIGAFPFEDYEDFLVIVNNGRLVNAINHRPGTTNMPYMRGKLDQCTIDKIEAWVNAGALNN